MKKYNIIIRMTGQITAKSALGEHIVNLSKNKKYRSYLDIGTLTGEGTTKCLMEGIRGRDDAYLISLEIDKNMWEIACKNYEPCPSNLKLIHGKLSNKMMSMRQIHSHKMYPKIVEHYMDHYLNDVFGTMNCPIVQGLANIDVVVMDGGEFCGTFEFEEVMKLNPKVIVMDDINVMKNCDNHEQMMKNNSNWILTDCGNDRNGWAIWQKVA